MTPSFQWEPGFVLSFAYSFPNTSWLLGLYWTSFDGKAAGRQDASVGKGSFPALAIAPGTLAGDYASSAKMKWKLKANLLDITAEYNLLWMRWCWFSLVPTFGIRNVWLRQTGHVEYNGGTYNAGPDQVTLRNNFYGIGPRVGIYPIFELPAGFRLYANLAAAGFVGWFDVVQKETFIATPLATFHQHSNGWKWNGDVSGGVIWEALINRDSMRLMLNLALDSLFFPDQNQLHQGPQAVNSGNLLYLWGLNISAHLGF